MDNDEARGPYNLTAPNASRQINFSRTLASKTGNKMQLPALAFMIKLAMGEMGKELLLSGQKVLPSKLIKEGFVFKYNTIEQAIEI
jgi:NAD dependent epimerase/dehydratase family enzyme